MLGVFDAAAFVAAAVQSFATFRLLRSRPVTREARLHALVSLVVLAVLAFGRDRSTAGDVFVAVAFGAGAVLSARSGTREKAAAPDPEVLERRLDEVFRTAENPLLVCTASGLILDANPAAAALIGRAAESIRGTPLAALIDVLDEQPDRIARSFAERMSGSLTGSRVYRVRFDPARTVWLEVESRPFATCGETLVLVSSRDVTAREEAAARARVETARWDLLVESLPAFTWTADEALRVTGARGRALETLGLSSKEVEGRTLAEIYAHLGLEAPADPNHLRALAGEKVRLEWRFGDRVFDGALVRLPGPDGKPVEVAGVALDVTDRERARREADEKAGTLDAILQQAPALVFLKDLEGRYLWVNRRWERVNALRSEQVVGRTDPELLGAAGEQYRAEDREVLASGGPAAFVHRIEGRRQVRYFVTTKFVLRDERGAPSAVCGISIDETERESLDRELRRGQALLEEAQSLANLANWEWDLTTGRHGWMSRVLDLYGAAPVEDVADFTIREGIFEEDRARVLEHVQSALHDDEPYDIEYRIRRKDGQLRWLRSKGRVERGADGKPLRFFGCAQDVTERRESADRLRAVTHDLERLVRERTAELETAVRDLERFSYSVSHDLRAPLRAIFGFLSLMKHEADLDDASRRYLGLVEKAAARMQSIISDLLTLSRVSHAKLHPSWVDLSEKALHVVEELAAAEPGREVRCTIEPGLRVLADAGQAELLLRNLVDNAFKFTRDAVRPEIEIGCEPGQAPPVFYVRDNGCGFDPSRAHQLFEPFRRLHESDELAGNGIGLATVSRITARHGGRVWAESRPEGGATIRFTLGAAPAATEQATPAATEQAA